MLSGVTVSVPGMLSLEMVTIDCADPARLTTFWTAALSTKVQLDHGEFVLLAAPGEGRVAVGLQKVPEPKSGKTRIHLDLQADDLEAEVARLVELGATELDRQRVPGLRWTVLADPEGNEFCVGQAEPRG